MVIMLMLRRIEGSSNKLESRSIIWRSSENAEDHSDGSW
jgi:hypothetical protein